MIHHSCDRCERLIGENEIRYIVNIEIVAAVVPDQETKSGYDHLEELGQLLDQLDNSDCAEIREDAYQRRKFDLCTQCRNEYLENPLAVERQVEFDFSKN